MLNLNIFLYEILLRAKYVYCHFFFYIVLNVIKLFKYRII